MGDEATPFLRNKYWILRHGKSIPNQRGIVVSSMENGILPEFGLALDGVHQAHVAAESLKKDLQATGLSTTNVQICYSPFTRTTHTAKVVADVLSIPFDGPQCKIMTELRERYFGSKFELQSHEMYSEIWAVDEVDPFMPPDGGESVANVVSRLSIALMSMEAEFQGCGMLVVSHGDPLQIFQTMVSAAKESVGRGDLSSMIQGVTLPSILSKHRKFALQTGELRRII